jgi:hypothetical protein
MLNVRPSCKAAYPPVSLQHKICVTYQEKSTTYPPPHIQPRCLPLPREWAVLGESRPPSVKIFRLKPCSMPCSASQCVTWNFCLVIETLPAASLVRSPRHLRTTARETVYYTPSDPWTCLEATLNVVAKSRPRSWRRTDRSPEVPVQYGINEQLPWSQADYVWEL